MDYNHYILTFYPDDTDLRRLLLKHSRQVADRSLQIAARHPELGADTELLEAAAMLHDIGIVRCSAPSILCHGDEPYIRHGLIGAEMLRSLAADDREALMLEPLARVCERHTGTGLTAAQIERQQLPLPRRDFCPETIEEQIVCYADKFYSKSSPDRVRSVEQTALSLEKFGAEGVRKFLAWAERFESV